MHVTCSCECVRLRVRAHTLTITFPLRSTIISCNQQTSRLDQLWSFVINKLLVKKLLLQINFDVRNVLRKLPKNKRNNHFSRQFFLQNWVLKLPQIAQKCYPKRFLRTHAYEKEKKSIGSVRRGSGCWSSSLSLIACRRGMTGPYFSLPISFSHEKIDEFMHPFVIVSEPDQFLLSSSATVSYTHLTLPTTPYV